MELFPRTANRSLRCEEGDFSGVSRVALLRMAAVLLLLSSSASAGELFRLPTANQKLFEPGGEEKFFVGTVGKPWTSGMFGCVRTEGWQIHEGLDIRCLQRDKRGEPIDPVMATADGVVVYVNRKPGLSNYGNYIILRHDIEGIEIFSIYAHLREIVPGVQTGKGVKAGEQIAIMGRTSNTREGIGRDRAHVHFELSLLINDRFAEWYRKYHPGERNDHGDWNGQNLLAIDPRAVLLEQKHLGNNFSLAAHLRQQTELFRVVVRDTNFAWLRRYTPLVIPNPQAVAAGIAGYEIAFNFNGVAFELIPRMAAEIRSKGRVQLLRVNEAEHSRNHCRKLVVRRGPKWELTNAGQNLINLLTY